MTEVPELPDWITLQQAARQLGMSASALRDRVRRGQLPEVRRIGRSLLVISEADLKRIARERSLKKARSRVSAAQAEYLTDYLTGRQRDYSWEITTGRALERKGLIRHNDRSWPHSGWQLTPEGKRIAESLIAGASDDD